MRWLMVAVALLTLWGSAPPACAAPATPPAVPVTKDEKAGVVAVIKELYQAYTRKDLEKIMALEHQCIEASAANYEKRGKGKADDVRDAFRGTTRDLLNCTEFGMKPLHLEDVEYRREGDKVIISSAIPIIATEFVQMGGEKVRVSMSKFWFKKVDGGWRIEQMDLH